MATAREIIKQWFENFKKPTQEHFWAWIDSFWHKNEKIPMSSVQNLEQSLQNVVTSDQFNNHINDGNAHQALFDKKVDKEDGKSLISDAERNQIQINKNKQVVGHTITGDVNKVSTLLLDDGSVIQADFTDVAPAGPDVMLNSLNFNIETGILTGIRSDGQQLTVDLNGRYALLGHTHDWGDITGKPATFPPSPHTHVVNWNDIQDKPDLSQLGAKSVIKVTVDTPSATKDKIGTTTSGNYVPKEGDELVVDFIEGTWVNSPTLNIDGSGAKNIMLSGRNPDRNNLSIGNTGQDKTVRLWYDGTNYQLYGATINTTYGVIPQQALENENNNYSYLISGAVVAWIRNWANIIGKPFKLIGKELNIVNPTNENELIPIKAKGFKIDGGTNNDVLLANGGKESRDNFFTFNNDNSEYHINSNNLNDFMTKRAGMYTIQYSGSHSDLLLNFNLQTGSTSALQLLTTYYHGGRLKVRKQIDNNRTSGTWRELAYYDDIPFQGGDVTGDDWTANLIESKNTIFLKGGGNKTIRLHQLENHTIMSLKKCYDSGTITFVCQGKTIVMRGADAFNGADGSNAVISIVDDKCYIDINNY
ncbi:hypothetical protein [Capnocytophaga canis]|uniref:hypothetical protein n=1 Tax=Capnocytophaga canis TaxID=1848903 RepID=UPI0037D54347